MKKQIIYLVHLYLREESRLVVDAVRVWAVDDAVADVGVVQLVDGRRRHHQVRAALPHRVVHPPDLKGG